MKFTQVDFEQYQKFSRYLEKCVDWRINTVGIIDVHDCIFWFNELGQKMKAELDNPPKDLKYKEPIKVQSITKP